MEDGWIEVFITESQYKAEMAKDKLESNGIKVVVLDQHDTATQSFGEFRIFVAAEDAVKSVELLKILKGE